jgi:hypothetical protein
VVYLRTREGETRRLPVGLFNGSLRGGGRSNPEMIALINEARAKLAVIRPVPLHKPLKLIVRLCFDWCGKSIRRGSLQPRRRKC